MSNFPGSFDEATMPLTLEIVGDKASEALAKLASAGYEVHAGLTAELADQIMIMSLEPAIRKYCPKDCRERFKDRASTEQWLAKKRGTFLLLKKADDGSLTLAGYAWVGDAQSSHVPGGETTFALRIGENYQGQGLATPFSLLTLLGAEKLYGAQKIWLETWASNEGAVHIYHKLGFVDTDQEPSELVSADGDRQPDTRLYMILPDEIVS
jgi:ribosomal protein S18 acetylase RimI-like enzyme